MPLPFLHRVAVGLLGFLAVDLGLLGRVRGHAFRGALVVLARLFAGDPPDGFGTCLGLVQFRCIVFDIPLLALALSLALRQSLSRSAQSKTATTHAVNSFIAILLKE